MSGSNQNPFHGRQTLINGPATTHALITPSDVPVWPAGTSYRALYIGVAGQLTVMLRDDTVAVTFPSVPAGFLDNIWVRQVFATGTTASGIIGLN